MDQQNADQRTNPRTGPTAALTAALDAERERLLRWCIYLTGRPDVADDLVQDTVAAAWMSHRPPERAQDYPAWLAGIARNRCRAWRRQQAREAHRILGMREMPDLGDAVSEREPLGLTDPFDVEVELERGELAHLLDRALALLPADTRQALVAKYVDESPLAQVAARLGMSEGAVAARLHRGKLALRRVLATDLRAEAAAYGLVRPHEQMWQQTTIWCPQCGRQRLLGRLASEEGDFVLRCPHCAARNQMDLVQWKDRALFAGLSSYRSALSRLSARGHTYYRAGLRTGEAACIRCGRLANVRLAQSDELPDGTGELVCVMVQCPTCRATHIAGLAGLLLCHPYVQRFWRAHPRLATLPWQIVEVGGRPSVAITFSSQRDRAQLDVIADRGTFEVLRMDEGATRVI